MKKSRRRAGWLVGMILGVGLVAMPREGAAFPIKWPEPDPPQMGDPDIPNGSPRLIGGYQLMIEGSTVLVVRLPEVKGKRSRPTFMRGVRPVGKLAR